MPLGDDLGSLCVIADPRPTSREKNPMRVLARFLAMASAVFLGGVLIPPSLLPWAAPNITFAATATVAVGPQYDSTHVYVAPDDFDRFVASLLATFGGTTTKQVVATVTPTPSSTISQLVLTRA